VLLPLAVGTMLVLYLFDVSGMRDLGLVETVLVGLGFVVVLGPLTWLRWNRMGRHDPAAWKFLGGALVWALVSLLAIIGGIQLLGVD